MEGLRRSRCDVTVSAVVAILSSSLLSTAATVQAFEGYGYQTIGGQGGTTYHVTNTQGDTSSGSFRWAMSQPNPKIVVFDVGGTITLLAPVAVRGESYITIDGTTAPSPGITIRPPSAGQGDAIYIESGAHDIIIKGLRFIGFDADGNGGDLVSLYGDPNPVYKIVVDHSTFEQADDGAIDITNQVHDVTVSWCFFHNNNKTQLIKYGVRSRLSLHHNVYASSPDKGERNPQAHGDLDGLDYVNNVIYGWYWYGMAIRHDGVSTRVNANVVNNLFTHEEWSTVQDALIYGSGVGADAEDGGPAGSPPQGTIVTNSDMGRLWVAGNILPPQNRDQYSTVSGPLAVPAAAQVTTWPASELTTRVLPTVGTVFRTGAEQTLLDEVAAADTPSALSVTGPSPVTEGNAGTVNAVFTVTLSPSSSSTVTVNYATANGTATSGSDYVAASGTLTFTAGQTSKTISVAVNGDTADEPDETFYLDLSNPTNATIATGQGTATIVDDDTPTVSMSINDVSVAEGNSGTANAVFTVTLSGTTAQTVTVNYATANGTATAGSDYSAQSGNLTFAPGQTTKTITIAVNGDTTVEPNETFLVNLSSPVGTTLADGQGQGTIANDDTAAGVPVVWTSLVGATASGGSLTKTAATAWGNAGAISTQQLPSGDGYVEFAASETTTYRMLGLSNGNTNSSWDDIDFALYLNLNEVRVYEGGIYKGSFGTYATGDILRVAVVGGVVRYSRNGTVFYSSTGTPAYPLLVDTSLASQGATLNNVVVAGFVGTPASTPVPVVWTSLVGVTASGGSLTKTAATAWGNAGAVSSQELPSGDGYVEFTASETTTYRMLGLSKGNTNSSWDDIDFALYLNLNEVRVYEGGIYKGSFGTYATGDIMRVAVVGGVVRYSRNGTVFYSSTGTPAYPLLVDTSLASQGATLNNVVVAGFVGTPAPNPVPVVWTSLVGVTASGGSLTKTAATAWGNAGAISTQQLSSGDGYVEFSASETTTYRMLGLSNGDTNSSWDDIDFALYLNLNEVRVYEGGIYKGSFGNYATGDIMRVAVVGGVVRYSRNGTVFYSSTGTPAYPLLVDTSLASQGATLNNVVVVGLQ